MRTSPELLAETDEIILNGKAMELKEIKNLSAFHITYLESERGTQIYLLSPSFTPCLISLVGHICLQRFICRDNSVGCSGSIIRTSVLVHDAEKVLQTISS
jgi:hypothetical protein